MRKSSKHNPKYFLLPVIETIEAPLDGEREMCKEFGCGKKLSLIESLAGNKCIKHTQEK